MILKIGSVLLIISLPSFSQRGKIYILLLNTILHCLGWCSAFSWRDSMLHVWQEWPLHGPGHVRRPHSKPEWGDQDVLPRGEVLHAHQRHQGRQLAALWEAGVRRGARGTAGTDGSPCTGLLCEQSRGVSHLAQCSRLGDHPGAEEYSDLLLHKRLVSCLSKILLRFNSLFYFSCNTPLPENISTPSTVTGLLLMYTTNAHIRPLLLQK